MTVRNHWRFYCRVLAAAGILVGAWIAVYLYAVFDTPLNNRSYAETWKGAHFSELPQSGRRSGEVERSDHAPGKSIFYSFNGRRGMKGRTYPGTFLALLVGNPRMESGTLFTPPADRTCHIEFLAGINGTIENIVYSGNDCD